MKKILTDIKEMIIHPNALYKRIDGKHPLYITLLTTCLISILFFYLFWNYQFFAMLNDPLHTEAAEWGKMTSTIVYTTTIAFVTFVIIILQSFYYLFSFNFVKGKNNVKISQVVQAVALTKIISIFSTFVSVIKASSLENIEFSSLVDFKKAIYVPLDMTFFFKGIESAWYRVAQTISLFPVWESIVVVLIFSKLYQLPIKKSLTPVIFIWLIKLLSAYFNPTNPALL